MHGFYIKQKILIAPLLFSLIAGCSESTTGVATLDVAGENCQNSTVQKALFIGNSYTFVNNLPSLFKDIACDAGLNVQVTSVTKGNYRFLNHASDATTLDAIKLRQWDFVILQNHSLIPSFKPEDVVTTSLPHAVTLANAVNINNSATQIIYFVTQGRENGDVLNCANHPLVCTFTGHTAALITGYEIYQDSTGGRLALAGNAWKAIVDDGSAPFDSGELWASDGSHPELPGSYLSASVIFATAFNLSPIGLAAPQGISETNARYLQQISTEVVGL